MTASRTWWHTETLQYVFESFGGFFWLCCVLDIFQFPAWVFFKCMQLFWYKIYLLPFFLKRWLQWCFCRVTPKQKRKERVIQYMEKKIIIIENINNDAYLGVIRWGKCLKWLHKSSQNVADAFVCLWAEELTSTARQCLRLRVSAGRVTLRLTAFHINILQFSSPFSISSQPSRVKITPLLAPKGSHPPAKYSQPPSQPPQPHNHCGAQVVPDDLRGICKHCRHVLDKVTDNWGGKRKSSSKINKGGQSF